MKKLLIKISVIILFLITSAQTNDDIKKLESDIKKAATDIAETLKIEVAIKGKKLTNFFTNNDLKLISENGLREYKFKNKTYEIIKDNEIIQSGSWKIDGLLKNQIRLISNSDQKKYYLKKISKKPWIYNYDKRPGSEGAEKEILHIRSSSKFNDIVSKVTFSFEEENSNKLSKNNDEDFKIKKVKKTKTKTVSTQDQKDQKIIKETLEDVPLTVSSKINNKDELREFLINNGMKYISTDGYYRIFSFNEDGKGTYYMDNKKKEMPIIWEVINKNTLKSGHPKIVEQRGWTILKIDFEKKKLYKDLSSINGEKYTFDVLFDNSNPLKAESPKTDPLSEKKVKKAKEKTKHRIDLSDYLIKNKLYLKKTHEYMWGKWQKLDLEDQKTLVFDFNLDKRGKLFHLEDKHEMKFVWNIVSSNSFNFKHPESPYSPSEIKLDFENNLAQDVIKEGHQNLSYEIIKVSDADIKKAKDDKIKEEKLLEEYNLVLDKEYADKKGFKVLKKLLREMRKCAHETGKLEFKVNKNSGVSRDIGNWINRAENAIDSNNTREMRVTHGNLRRLAHHAFSSVATSYGVDNSTARFCKSLDTNYKFKHSIKFTEWKNKKMKQ